MRQYSVMGALLLIVGLLVGGYVSGQATTQQALPFCCNDLFLDPDRYVIIEEGNDFTVPSDRVLLIGECGGIRESNNQNINDSCDLYVNGVLVYQAGLTPESPVLEPGIAAPPGDVVSVRGRGDAKGRALGKLYIPN